MTISPWKLVAVPVLLAAMTACSGNSETAKQRLIETGNKYFTQGKYKEASLIYRNVIKKDALYGEAYYRLGLSELKAGRYAEAVRAFRRASELQPQNNDAHAKLADLYMAIYLADKNRNKTLITDLRDLKERLLKLNPKSFEGLRIQGYIELADNNIQSAITSFRAADAVNPDQAALSLVLAEALWFDKQEDEAIAKVKAAIEKTKDFFPLYDFLYIRYAGKNQDDLAEQVLRQKMANNPKQSMPMLELAGHFTRLRKPDQARKSLEGIIAKIDQFPDAYQQAGDFYFRVGDYTSAQDLYEQGLKAKPDQALTINKKLVEMFAIQNKNAEALALAEKLVASNGDDSEVKALRASLRLRSGKKEEMAQAVTEFQSVIAKLPNNPVVRFNLGEALAASGDLEKARVQYAEAIKLRPNYIPPKIASARVHMSRGEFGKAQQFAEEVMAQQPNLVVPYLLRASALMGINDLKGARAQLEDLLKKKADLPDARFLLAQVNLIDKRHDSAEGGFRDMLGSGDARGLFGLVDVMMATKRHDDAIRMLRKELDRSDLDKRPAYAKALRTALGTVYMNQRQFPEAAQLYGQLAAEDPQAADMQMRHGDALLAIGRHADAYAAYEKAKNVTPDRPEPYFQMAMALETMGKRNESQQLYDQVLKLQTDDKNASDRIAIAQNNKAYYLMESNGDLDLALSLAQKAKQKLPQNPDISDTLGLVYIKKNLADDAIRIFQDLVRQRPAHVTWRYHLAMALAQKGDKLQARKELETALKNGPKPDEEKKIRDLQARI